MPSQGTQGLSNWRFKDDHVQQAINQGKFISFESSVIAFGPPNLSDLAAASSGGVVPSVDSTIAVFPTGMIESFTSSQQQATNKVYELGSVRAYVFAGRPDGQASFNRILYHGPSALRAAYASFRDKNNTFSALVGNSSPGVQVIDTGDIAPGTVDADGGTDSNFFFNMQNVLFRNPFGFLVYMKDTQGKPFAGQYYENTLVGGHTVSISAGSVTTMEQVTVTFERILPVNVIF